MQRPEDLKLITSRDNPVFKLARSLGSRKGREKTGKFLVEGVKLVKEALAHPELVETILVSDAVRESLVDDLLNYGIPLVRISSGLAQTLAETETTQGVWAICRRPEWGGVEETASLDFILVMVQIQDPGNLGTMLRTAWAVGVQAVLLTAGSVDVYNPKVIRSAMGATFNLPIYTGVSLSDVEGLRKQGFRVLACDPRGEMSLFQSDLQGKLTIVMGNEGQGLSPDWKRAADHLLKIPLAAEVESLNVAVACGIILYEAYRQRNRP
ncbi:MAG: RNA methyltransferase [Syntrophomonadaceae bacterium]|nr:RNA methyltransferase [Syntrophomonadaceae bacterium]